MIGIKDEFIALKGIRVVKFLEAWRRPCGKCGLQIIYRDDKEIIIDVDNFEEYKDLANKISTEKNYLELYD